MCSPCQPPALSRRVFVQLLPMQFSRRSRDSSKISHSSRRVHSSKLAGGDAQCQCSSFFTVSQPARAAQPAAIGRTRPQPAGTRFRTRSFHLMAKGLSACSRGCLRCLWKFMRARSRGRRLQQHVSGLCGLVPVCSCAFYICTCGATALRVSYMPDCPYA